MAFSGFLLSLGRHKRMAVDTENDRYVGSSSICVLHRRVDELGQPVEVHRAAQHRRDSVHRVEHISHQVRASQLHQQLQACVTEHTVLGRVAQGPLVQQREDIPENLNAADFLLRKRSAFEERQIDLFPRALTSKRPPSRQSHCRRLRDRGFSSASTSPR